jgi:uncharacterized protein YndB with AHSA1/START domain
MNANALPEQDVVTAEMEIAAPAERIFQAITDPVQVRHWGSSKEFEITVWEMDLRRGGRWRFVSRETDPSGQITSQFGVSQFEHHGEILEIDPPRLLVYTWFTNFHKNPSHATVVRWDLTPTAGGTRVKITHSGLAVEPEARKAYSGGWVGMLQAVRAYTESSHGS